MATRKKRSPTDSTMRNVQSMNRRVLAIERRLTMLSRHMLAALKGMDKKIDAIVSVLRIDG